MEIRLPSSHPISLDEIPTLIGSADVKWLMKIAHEMNQKAERCSGCQWLGFLRIACALARAVALVCERLNRVERIARAGAKKSG
jgi:hypothetical protein